MIDNTWDGSWTSEWSGNYSYNPEPPEEPSPGLCDACGYDLHAGEYAMGILVERGGEMERTILCEECAEGLSAAELLEVLGIDYRRGRADDLKNGYLARGAKI